MFLYDMLMINSKLIVLTADSEMTKWDVVLKIPASALHIVSLPDPVYFGKSSRLARLREAQQASHHQAR